MDLLKSWTKDQSAIQPLSSEGFELASSLPEPFVRTHCNPGAQTDDQRHPGTVDPFNIPIRGAISRVMPI
ncbi:MAG: hypothetical protein CMN98_04725 [Synechococcus sp. NP17]|nr:hypothetical protein [Synechococcus sp. NP17]